MKSAAIAAQSSERPLSGSNRSSVTEMAQFLSAGYSQPLHGLRIERGDNGAVFVWEVGERKGSECILGSVTPLVYAREFWLAVYGGDFLAGSTKQQAIGWLFSKLIDRYAGSAPAQNEVRGDVCADVLLRYSEKGGAL